MVATRRSANLPKNKVVSPDSVVKSSALQSASAPPGKAAGPDLHSNKPRAPPAPFESGPIEPEELFNKIIHASDKFSRRTQKAIGIRWEALRDLVENAFDEADGGRDGDELAEAFSSILKMGGHASDVKDEARRKDGSWKNDVLGLRRGVDDLLELIWEKLSDLGDQIFDLDDDSKRKHLRLS